MTTLALLKFIVMINVFIVFKAGQINFVHSTKCNLLGKGK